MTPRMVQRRPLVSFASRVGRDLAERAHGDEVASLGLGQEQVHRRVVMFTDRHRPGGRLDRQPFEPVDQRLLVDLAGLLCHLRDDLADRIGLCRAGVDVGRRAAVLGEVFLDELRVARRLRAIQRSIR